MVNQDFVKDLLNEIKGFKYQITVKTLLRKHKENGDIEFASVYLNCTTKTVINSEYYLNKSFQEILHGIDNWINGESGWINKYVNTFIYSPLSAS